MKAFFLLGLLAVASAIKTDDMTTEQFKGLLGANLDAPMTLPVVSYAHLTQFINLPDEFDSRTAFPGCVHPVMDQGHCGSCWAFAASESLSDRLCIASKNAVNVVLSPQDLTSCDKYDNACNGGQLESPWKYMSESGVVSLSCLPYTSGQAGEVPACPSTCKNGEEWTKYFAQKDSAKRFGDEESIKLAIMTHGPVMTGFRVYEDFKKYKKGVYQHEGWMPVGGHAVEIVGWGIDKEDGNKPYWLVKNSWGEKWAELGGYFKMLRGKNECEIESMAIAGLAQL